MGIMGGELGDASNIVGQTLAAVGTAAVPSSLQPVKETAGRFLQKAQPWREFCLPLSMPSGSDCCTRVTGNLYNFQTNYAILFVIYLVISILLHPSALVGIVVVSVVW